MAAFNVYLLSTKNRGVPFTEVEGAEAMNEAVSQFLSLLGWDHTRTGAKGKPCASALDVLDMML